MPSECNGQVGNCSCILCLIFLLKKYVEGTPETASQEIVAEFGRDPFLILVSCILSLRTRDTVSLPASRRLFQYFRSPHDFKKASVEDIEKLIFPVGFYHQKSAQIKKLSQQLIDDFDGKVPKTEKALLSLKGVGRKTANLVLGIGFKIPAICVDTHVHRLANQWGLVCTVDPEETERELKKIVPQEFWIALNDYMVRWGQFKCKSNTKNCTSCSLLKRVCTKTIKNHPHSKK